MKPDPDWVERAACRGSLFPGLFPVGSGIEARALAAQAIERYCHACPVVRECWDAIDFRGDRGQVRGARFVDDGGTVWSHLALRGHGGRPKKGTTA